jgi:hypothetical protein
LIDEDMPLFPVDRPLFDEVRRRIEMAKELEQLEHSHRRTQSDEGWLNKAAKELDLHFDEYDDLYPSKHFFNRNSYFEGQIGD